MVETREKMAEMVTDYEINNFREAFRLFDVNNTGHVTLEELKQVLETIGYTSTDHDLNQRLMEIDRCGNGVINFDDFVSIVSESQQFIEDNEMNRLFLVFDLNQSGFITIEELKIVLKRLGFTFNHKQVEAMLSFADTAGDGRICYEEFLKINNQKIHSAKKKRKRCTSFTLSHSQIIHYKNAFQVYDIQANDSISFQGLKKLLHDLEINLNDKDLDKHLNEIERRNVDVITFDEFISVVVSAKNDVEHGELMEACRHFDVTDSGYVQKKDLQQVLLEQGFSFTEKQIESMLQYADTQNEDTIDYRVFIEANDFRLHRK